MRWCVVIEGFSALFSPEIFMYFFKIMAMKGEVYSEKPT